MFDQSRLLAMRKLSFRDSVLLSQSGGNAKVREEWTLERKVLLHTTACNGTDFCGDMAGLTAL